MAISGLGSIRPFDHAGRSAERAAEQVSRGAAGESARASAAQPAAEGATDVASLTEGMVGTMMVRAQFTAALRAAVATNAMVEDSLRLGGY